MPTAGAMPASVYESGPAFAGYRLPFPGANAVLGPRDVGIWFEGESGDAGGSGSGGATSSGSGAGDKGGAGPSTATGEDTLGDAGREAIRREREAARTERERAEKLQKELDDFKAANQSEQEKTRDEAVKLARGEERTKAQGAFRTLRVEASLTAAGMKPGMARDLATSSRFATIKVNDDFTVDQTALDAAIEEMKKAEPAYFSASATNGQVARGPQHASNGSDQVRPGGDRLRNAYANSSKR